jgi:hypothetical protein
VRSSLLAIASASDIEFVGVLLTGAGAQALRNNSKNKQKYLI